MTTMPNVVNSANSSQMSTPIKSLPLKTTQQNEHDIEDPLIQGVLKEFEDSAMANAPPPPPVNHAPPVMTPPPQVQYLPPPPPPSYAPPVLPEPVQTSHLDYNSNDSKKLFDLDTVKRATIVTIILVLFQNNNILNMGVSRLPSSVTNHISGREIFLNTFMVFVIVYALMYFGFV